MNRYFAVTILIISLVVSVSERMTAKEISIAASESISLMVTKKPVKSIKSESFIIYPNPTKSNITLKTELNDIESLRYQLFDMTGIVIQEGEIENAETLIEMEHLAPSVYFLRIKRDNLPVKLFKIIKN